MKILKLLFDRKVLLVLGVLLAGATAAVLVVLRPNSSTDVSNSTSPAAAAPSPAFSFDTNKATGWRQGPVNETSIVLFKKNSDCFVSTDLRDGAVDEAQALNATITDLGAGGYTATASGTVGTAFDRAAKSPAPYTLHQYTVSGAGSAGQVYKTQFFGYVPLDQKHVRVQAYCNDDTSLSEIKDALAAIVLDSK